MLSVDKEPIKAFHACQEGSGEVLRAKAARRFHWLNLLIPCSMGCLPADAAPLPEGQSGS